MERALQLDGQGDCGVEVFEVGGEAEWFQKYVMLRKQQKPTRRWVQPSPSTKEQGPVKKKKPLADPKMWPIYHNYRKLFSNTQMRQLKRLKVIGQQGRLGAPVQRNRQKVYTNRSNHLKSHNHLTHNWNLYNKKALFMNLKIYYQALNMNPFQYIPMTFHITDLASKEFALFQQQYDKRSEAIKQDQLKKKQQQGKHTASFKPRKRNAWLVKPGQNTNQGVGIQVVESIEEIREIVGRERVDSKGRPRTHIIQQYIYPFLYQKRKFDIRTYMVVTSLNGHLKGYWYQDGYIRTACKEFNMKNLNNKFVHLTNDAVQKHHEDYGKHEPANKISYADFQRYLDASVNTGQSPKLKFFQHAYPDMKKIAADSIRAVYTKMNPQKKDFTFEIFGLDFMIDQSFKVWLIEVNTNPCLEMACPLLTRLIPSMLQNTFKLVIDPLFPPPPLTTILNNCKKFPLADNILENNKYELIFEEVEEGRELRHLLCNAPQVMIEEVDEEQEYDQNFQQVSKQLSKPEPDKCPTPQQHPSHKVES